MAYQFLKFPWVNGYDTMYQLKQHLVSVGWEMKTSCTGTSAPQNSDVITSSAILQNQNSFYVLKMPAISGVRRELMINNYQNDHRYWKNAYSAGAGFAGGTQSAAPTATDQVFGCCTGWSNNFASYRFFDTDSSGPRYVIICADNAAPYGFYLATFSTVQGAGVGPDAGYFSTGGLMLDPMVSGTYAALDADPYIYYCHSHYPRFFLRGESLQSTSGDYSIGRGWGWVRRGLSSEGNYPFYLSSLGYRGSLTANPYTGKDDTCAATYVLGAWQPHIKGTSSMVRWIMQSRNTGDTLSVASNRDRIVIGHCAMPWDGTTPTF